VRAHTSRPPLSASSRARRYNCNASAFKALLFARGSEPRRPHPQEPGSTVARSVVASSIQPEDKCWSLLVACPEMLGAWAAGRQGALVDFATMRLTPPESAVRYIDSEGWSTLHHVAYNSSLGSFKALLNAPGADGRVTNKGQTVAQSAQSSLVDSTEKLRAIAALYPDQVLQATPRRSLEVQPNLLCLAAEAGRSDDVCRMCDSNPPEAAVNFVDEAGISVLHHAAYKCSATAFARLISKGADPRKEHPSGESSLRSRNLTSALTSDPSLPYLHRAEPGSTALVSCYKSPVQQMDKCKALLAACPDILCMTAAAGRSDELHFACNAGPGPSAANGKDTEGISVAHHAAFKCSPAAFGALLARGADGRCPHPRGACAGGTKKHSPLSAHTRPLTRPLHLADPASTVLLSCKASCYEPVDKAAILLARCPELLCMAAARGRSEEVIFACAANPSTEAMNCKDAEGITPLHHAAYNCSTAAVAALLGKGADGNTPHPQDPGSSVVRSCRATNLEGKEKLRLLLARFPNLLANAAGRRRSMDVIAICAADPPLEAVNYADPSGTSALQSVAFGCSPAAFQAMLEKGPFIPSGLNLEQALSFSEVADGEEKKRLLQADFGVGPRGSGLAIVTPASLGDKIMTAAFNGLSEEVIALCRPYNGARRMPAVAMVALDSDGFSALQHAAYKCSAAAFETLLTNGWDARREQPGQPGSSVLISICNSSVEAPAKCKALLAACPDILCHAASNGQSEEVAWVCAMADVPEGVVNWTDAAGISVAHHAAFHCSPTAFGALLARGADARCPHPQDPTSSVVRSCMASPQEGQAKARVLSAACPDMLNETAARGNSAEFVFLCCSAA